MKKRVSNREYCLQISNRHFSFGLYAEIRTQQQQQQISVIAKPSRAKPSQEKPTYDIKLKTPIHLHSHICAHANTLSHIYNNNNEQTKAHFKFIHTTLFPKRFSIYSQTYTHSHILHIMKPRTFEIEFFRNNYRTNYYHAMRASRSFCKKTFFLS